MKEWSDDAERCEYWAGDVTDGDGIRSGLTILASPPRETEGSNRGEDGRA
jgi:hypothetical protein